jgi:apolipoprotein N-acyltransferase
VAALVLFTAANLVEKRDVDREIAAAARKKVAVVQGDIPQDEKWDPAFQEKTLKKYLDLSRRALAEGPEIVVWPETALPFYPLESPLWRMLNERLTVPARVVLVTGAPHRETGPSGPRYHNSAFAAGPSGVLGRYDKQHLVPFGEYVPLRRLLFFLSPVVDSIGDFTPGTDGAPLACNGLRIGVLICFETIFPELAAERTRKGADLLVDLTNDAWYGMTSAPWQDLAMAVFRAVECRRAVARAANTGFSGFIDPAGRIHRRSPLFAPYVAVRGVALMKTRTFMVFGPGRFFGPACMLAVLAALAAGLRRRRPEAAP